MENVFGDHEEDEVEGLQNKEAEDGAVAPQAAPVLPLPLLRPPPVRAPGLSQAPPPPAEGLPVPLMIALGLGALGVLAWALTLPKKRNGDIDDLGEDDDEDDDDFDDDEEDDSDEEDEESTSESEDSDDPDDDDDDEEDQDEEESPDEGEDDEGE